MNTRSVTELQLGLDQNRELWRQDAGSAPASLGSDWAAFLRSEHFSRARSVLVTADRQNASLLTQLFFCTRQQNSATRIVLLPPRTLYADLGDAPCLPDQRAVDAADLPPSLGGWRTMTRFDYATYALAQICDACVWRGKLRKAGPLRPWLVRHPAFPAFQFSSTYRWSTACRVIADLLDPRWHLDLKKPDAGKRIGSYMGVGHKGLSHLQGWADDKWPWDEAPATAKRAMLLMMAWAGAGNLDKYVICSDNARDFFWNVMGARTSPRFLSATRCFLRFVSQVWLDGLTPPRLFVAGRTMLACQQYSPQLFVADHFFPPAAAKAFRRRQSCWRRMTDKAPLLPPPELPSSRSV